MKKTSVISVEGMVKEKGLLTVKEAAEILNVHPNTVRTWGNLGLLPVYRVGPRRDRRFRRGDLDAFVVPEGG